ncbi:hypothetical protein F5144DRAFT_489559 [Chaetomium tenue]|uniref:Uncharacterized protein n=1 Tax=Chaetomium tenue TaxID=1854479 RepID=A0ACB7PE10_9PEZI|nr:hypothetical protein F5144DRAFT_489559 [Chaetomium globosum]
MADPLSVAGLAAGMVSLGLQVCGGITSYLDALKCGEQDIASTRQQIDRLGRALQAVEASLPQPQQEHQAPTAAVHGCLDSCNQELKGLETLMAHLAGPDQNPSGGREKIQALSKRLCYPFNRPKIEQLEMRLRNTNATLQLALQALGISMSRAGTEKLAVLESTSRSLSAGIVVVQTELAAIATPVRELHAGLPRLEGIPAQLDRIETLLSEQLTIGSSAGSVMRPQDELRMANRVATGRLLAKPSALREICDVSGAVSSPESNGHDRDQFWNLVRLLAGRAVVCRCRPRRHIRRNNFAWSSLVLSVETTVQGHLPGCPLGQAAGTNRSKMLNLRYTGLWRILNSAVQLSFGMTRGAGGWSISPSFTYYPTVDAKTAPAFRILTLLRSAMRFIAYKDPGPRTPTRLEELVARALVKLVTLFQTGKASPLAVDSENQSLVHYAAEMADASPSTPIYMLTFLSAAPVHWIWRASGIIRQSDPDIMPVSSEETLSDGPGACWWEQQSGDCYASTLLDLLKSSTEIAEGILVLCVSNVRLLSPPAYGCGPLSLAILANNDEEVERLLDNYPATVNERNLSGQSPLHLAADKPSYLRLLVRTAGRALLEATDNAGVSALIFALNLSGWVCREKTSRRMCRQCECAECFMILIKEGNCAVPVHYSLQSFLKGASQQCRLQYARALKLRRDELKQLSLEILPADEAAKLGLHREGVLDYFAPSAVLSLERRGVRIPGALDIERDLRSLYQLLDHPSDANLFFRVGFRDTNIWGDSVFRNKLSHTGIDDDYLRWLGEHGSEALFDMNGDISGTSATFVGIAEVLYHFSFDNIEEREAVWLRGLNRAALRAEMADDCHCKCSPGGCTPLTFILHVADLNNTSTPPFERMRVESTIDNWVRYMMDFPTHLEEKHHLAALRYFTFKCLNIPHTCCRRQVTEGAWLGEEEQETDEVEDEHDVDEVEEEYAHCLLLLEELLVEFEPELTTALQASDPVEDWDLEDTGPVGFWRVTWVNHMKQVVGELCGNELSDDERRAAEEVGVVWDRPTPPEEGQLDNVVWNGLNRPEEGQLDKPDLNSYGFAKCKCCGTILNMDYWFVKLEEIEVE